MTTLPHRLDRTVLIQAERETVFRYFTDSTRWALWWGAGSTIEARAGGRLFVRHPNGIESIGEVVEIDPPTRIVFTYGFVSGTPIPPGASRVTIRLESVPSGTQVHLAHEFAESGARDEHVQGWRYQLALFCNVVTDEANSGAAGAVDAWFRAWSDPDATARETTLATVATPDIRFRDRFSAVEGLADLSTHLEAAQRFMPGLTLQREGDVRHCQGIVLADWVARSTDGHERARGTNVFLINSRGLFESVTGFWSAHPRA
jgi:uncharacterized protein YndB with AHSA1/START domain